MTTPRLARPGWVAAALAGALGAASFARAAGPDPAASGSPLLDEVVSLVEAHFFDPGALDERWRERVERALTHEPTSCRRRAMRPVRAAGGWVDGIGVFDTGSPGGSVGGGRCLPRSAAITTWCPR